MPITTAPQTWPSTASTLGIFAKQLDDAGLTPEQVDRLVFLAAEHIIKQDGLFLGEVA